MARNFIGTGLSLVTRGLMSGMDLPPLASVIDTDTIGGETGTAVAAGSPPGDPSLISATVGDGQVTLAVEADDPADVIYARYRSYPNGEWSDESASFRRTGDGDIVVTGLENATKYEFAIYTRDGDATSDWDMIVSTPISADDTAPTDVLEAHSYPRERGAFAVIWLSAQDPWAFEQLKVVAKKLGRLR